jgi:hypothetical protein
LAKKFRVANITVQELGPGIKVLGALILMDLVNQCVKHTHRVSPLDQRVHQV